MGSQRFVEKDDDRTMSVDPLMTPMSRVFRAPINWLWPGRMVKDNLTLLAGNPGVGKSLLALDLAARLSRGKDWPDGQRNGKPAGTVLLKTEDDLHYSSEPALEQAGADLDMIESLDGVRMRGKAGTFHRKFVLSRDFKVLAKAIQRVRDCKLVIIDPLPAFLTGRGNARETLTELVDLARSMHVAILGVTHLKPGGREAMYRMLGAFDLTTAARAVWLVTRDPANRERRLVLPVKNNLTGEGGGLAYRLIVAPDRAPRVEWLEKDVAMTADEALAGMRQFGPAAEQRLAAVEFLAQALADGPRLVKDVHAEGWHAHGISAITMHRARKALRIVAFRNPIPGPWWIRLRSPEDDNPTCKTSDNLDHLDNLAKNLGKTAGLQGDPRLSNDHVGNEGQKLDGGVIAKHTADGDGS